MLGDRKAERFTDDIREIGGRESFQSRLTLDLPAAEGQGYFLPKARC